MKKVREFVDRELPEFRQSFVAEAEAKRLGLEPGPFADFAKGVAAVTAQEDADMHAIGPGLEPVEKSAHPVPDAMLPGLLGITALPFEDPLLVHDIHLVEGSHETESPRPGATLKILLTLVVGVSLKSPHKALGDGKRLVRDRLVEIDADDFSKSPADRTGAERMIETEEPGSRWLQFRPRLRGSPTPRERSLFS